ncbi:MAG TPA: hypothetical protein VHN82_07970, partial [Methanoregula sp.]|nr:hypothetical protein [Methanoregula sp.]
GAYPGDAGYSSSLKIDALGHAGYLPACRGRRCQGGSGQACQQNSDQCQKKIKGGKIPFLHGVSPGVGSTGISINMAMSEKNIAVIGMRVAAAAFRMP